MRKLPVIFILYSASAVSSWSLLVTPLTLQKARGCSQRQAYRTHVASSPIRIGTSLPSTSTTSSSSNAEEVDNPTQNDIKPCYYQQPNGRWAQRVELKSLTVGQELIGKRIAKADLLQGTTTGPKIFFECGVGRINSRGHWQMVSGMLRLGTRFAKPSVIRKKVSRLADKEVSLYVHRIRLETGELEVVTSQEVLEEKLEEDLQNQKVSVSSLQVGQELVGKVVDVRDFGCIVDVGANRNGLLHVQKVADLYGRYIAKKEGLEDAGLERGAEIRVSVLSNEKKRLFLDFTLDVKEEAERQLELERQIEDEEAQLEEDQNFSSQDEDVVEPTSSSTMSEEEAMWAAYSADDFVDDGYDDHDEDADIEDAFGLGSY